MVEFTTPLGIWMQLANLSFLFAGFYADLLMVRLLLFSAYGWLWINACLGSPLWGSPINEGYFALDGFIWATVNLWTLITGISRLLLDEADVDMGSEELEALWRLLYRMGGVSRKIAKLNVMPHCTVVEMKIGQKLDSEKYFFIVYQGNVQVELQEHSSKEIQQQYMDGSGAIFDYKSLGLVNEETYRATFHQVDTVVTCATSVTLFRFPKEIMRDLASNPALRNVWQTIFISQMARLVIMQSNNNNRSSEATTKAGLESSRVRSVVLTPGRVASLFLPLKDDEQPPSTLSGSAQNLKSLRNLIKHIWRYALSSFYLPWPVHGHPTGMRHELSPPQNKWVGFDRTSQSSSRGKKEEKSADDSGPGASIATQKSNANSEESLAPVDEEAARASIVADTSSSYLMI